MWNSEDLAFNKLINRVTTDSDGKKYYEEFGDKTINITKSEIWDSLPDQDPAQAVIDGIAQLYTLFLLTEDVTVPGQRTFYAGPTFDARLKDWISPKYGSDYQIQLFDNSNNLIDQTNSVDWYFDYVTGILVFNGDTSGFTKPFKVTGYRYIGLLGVSVASNVYMEQAFTSQTSVVVNHNWDTRPVVSIIDAANEVIEADVTYTDLDNVTVTFSLPQSGTIILQSGTGVVAPYLPLSGGTMSGDIEMNGNSFKSDNVLFNFSGTNTLELTTDNGGYAESCLYLTASNNTFAFGNRQIFLDANQTRFRTFDGVNHYIALPESADGTLALTSDITASISDVAYNATTWNGVTTIAPSKNVVRDEFENRVSKLTGTVLFNYPNSSAVELTTDNGAYLKSFLYLSNVEMELGFNYGTTKLGLYNGYTHLTSTDVYLTANSGNGIRVKSGSSYFANLKTTNLTTSRDFEFPDATGTIALTSDLINGYVPFNPISNITIDFSGSYGMTFDNISNVIFNGVSNNNVLFDTFDSFTVNGTNNGDFSVDSYTNILFTGNGNTIFDNQSQGDFNIEGALNVTINDGGLAGNFNINDFGNFNVNLISIAGNSTFSLGNGTFTVDANNIFLTGDVNLNSGTSFSSLLQTSLLTADRTFEFPDATGTLALTSDLSSYLPLAGGTLTDGANIDLGTTTGTRIGTTTSQMLAFWGQSPVVQQSASITAAIYSAVGGSNVQENDTFDGYTIGQIVAALRTIGALA